MRMENDGWLKRNEVEKNGDGKPGLERKDDWEERSIICGME